LYIIILPFYDYIINHYPTIGSTFIILIVDYYNWRQIQYISTINI